MFHAQDIRQLNAIFRDLATALDIGRGEPSNGCEYRAAQARDMLRKHGYKPGSLLLYAVLGSALRPVDARGRRLSAPKSLLRKDDVPYSTEQPIQWGVHMAACVRIKNKRGKTVTVVLDPVVCDGPVRLAQYLKLFGPVERRRLIFDPRQYAKAERKAAQPDRYELSHLEMMLASPLHQRRFAAMRSFRTPTRNARKLPLAHNPYRTVDRMLLPVQALKA